jgi:hypothetical protein
VVRVEPGGDIVVFGPPDQMYGRISGNQILTNGSSDGSSNSGIRVQGDRLVTFHDASQTGVLGMIDPPSMGCTALIMAAAFFIELAIQ